MNNLFDVSDLEDLGVMLVAKGVASDSYLSPDAQK